jgi:hypothetical protein
VIKNEDYHSQRDLRDTTKRQLRRVVKCYIIGDYSSSFGYVLYLACSLSGRVAVMIVPQWLVYDFMTLAKLYMAIIFIPALIMIVLGRLPLFKFFRR